MTSLSPVYEDRRPFFGTGCFHRMSCHVIIMWQKAVILDRSRSRPGAWSQNRTSSRSYLARARASLVHRNVIWRTTFMRTSISEWSESRSVGTYCMATALLHQYIVGTYCMATALLHQYIVGTCCMATALLHQYIVGTCCMATALLHQYIASNYTSWSLQALALLGVTLSRDLHPD